MLRHSSLTIVCDNFKPISITGNTQIITAGSTSQFIYICSYNLNIGTPGQAVAFVEGTGSTCGTGTVGVVAAQRARLGCSLRLMAQLILAVAPGPWRKLP
jgi:hypothetical protein